MIVLKAAKVQIITFNSPLASADEYLQHLLLNLSSQHDNHKQPVLISLQYVMAPASKKKVESKSRGPKFYCRNYS